MREQFKPWRPSDENLELVRIANAICQEMAAAGYSLTLRQLYYQFVARDYIPNTERSYKNLGEAMSRARLAGLLDWDYLEDRTRSLAGYNISWNVPSFVNAQRGRYFLDHWEGQEYRVEVWVEKEALVSVVAQPALRMHVDYFACRGYVSISELYVAAQRHLEYEAQGQHVVVIHLGDHDPSGIDMTRDVEERLETFGTMTEVRRIALNRDQIDHYQPPPNPAKLSDSRAKGYVARHGRQSWELDALRPQVIDDLIRDTIMEYVDTDQWNAVNDRQREDRALLERVASRWDEVVELVKE